jgi:translation initiation factor eIF-2B subunit beta
MMNDIECVYEEITRQAPEHINQKDVILTFSESDLLISFLKAAHQGVEEDDQVTQGKDFEVLVCETAPLFKGHKTAKSLQEEGIDAKIITDSSVYALMSGVDKIIISTHAIMANGGLLAHAGAY